MKSRSSNCGWPGSSGSTSGSTASPSSSPNRDRAMSSPRLPVVQNEAKRPRTKSPTPTDYIDHTGRKTSPCRLLPTVLCPNFVGRGTELKQLAGALHKQGKSPSLVSAVIVGPLGSGKSALAFRLVQDLSSKYHHILWLPWRTLGEGLVASAIDLNIPAPSSDSPESRQALLGRLFSTLSEERTLLIYDSVPNFGELLPWLPSLPCGNLSVVVTSQHTKWHSAANKITIDGLTPPASLQMLKQALPASKETDLREVAELLGHMPAGLALAISHIRRSHATQQPCRQPYRAEEFLKEFKHDLGPLLEKPPPEGSQYPQLPIAFERAVQDLSTLSCRLLGMAALLEQDQVGGALLCSPLLGGSRAACEEALLALRQSSLVRLRSEKLVLSRLVQQLAKRHFRDSRDEHVCGLLLLIEKDLDLSGRYPIFRTEGLVSHAVTLWPHVSDDLAILFSKVPVGVASSSWELGRRLLVEGGALETLKRLLGPGDLDLLRLTALLAAPPPPQQQYSAADIEKLSTLVSEVLSHVPAELAEHRETLRLRFRQGELLLAQDDARAAWQTLEPLYARQQDSLGLDSDDTLDTLTTLTEAASRQKEARVLETCLSLVYKRFSNTRLDHRKSLAMMKLVPEKLRRAARNEETLRLYDCLHETLETALGETDDLTLDAQLAKTECMAWQGRKNDAWKALTALHTRQLQAGNETAKTLKVMCTLATTLQDNKKGWELCISLLQQRARNQQADHEHTLALLHDAAFTHGSYVEAVKLYDTLLTTLPQLPKCQPLIARALQAKAECLLQTGRLEEAWNALKSLHAMQQETPVGEAATKTLALLGQVACDLEAPARLAEWTIIVNQLPDWEQSLKVLERLANSGSATSARALPLYDGLQATLTQRFGERVGLRALLGRAWHAFCLERRDEAWRHYLEACRALDLEPEPRSHRRWDFCNALGKLIQLVKDTSTST